MASNGDAAEAALLWSPANPSGASARVVTGAFFDTNGDSRVTVATQDAGSSQVAGSAEFLLALPPATHPFTLSASPWAWWGAVAAFAGVVMGGVVYARRRDQRLARDL